MTKTQTPLDQFLSLSAILTGFEAVELTATGLVETYCQQLFLEVPTAQSILEFWTSIATGDRTTDENNVATKMWIPPMQTPLQSITILWYIGTWVVNPTDTADQGSLLSADSYLAGLVWPAIGAKPMGARPTGYGSWSLPPTEPVLPSGCV